MNDIRINVTLSPHVQKGKPTGYYVIAERLFPRGTPILVKQQFVGYSNGLVISVAHPPQVESVLGMGVICNLLSGRPVTWLSTAPLYTLPGGFRSYVNGRVLKPHSAEARKFTTTGIFRGYGELYWLEIPAVSGDVLLGRKELGNESLW
jgi:hypothetical protein